MFERVLSIVFPRTCLSCGSWGNYFCDSCSSNLTFSVQKPICPLCTKSSVGGATHPQCRTKYTLDGLISVFRYKAGIRKGVQKVKYSRQFDIANTLTRQAQVVIERDVNKHYVAFDWFTKKYKPTLTPIPLYWTKQRKRWFNQSEYYAKPIAKYYNLEVINDVLIRTKPTTPQAQLKRHERLKNIKGAFGIKSKHMCKSKSFLVIDDVWTTGATMREAANTLKRAGAEHVWGLTIAR